MTAGAQDSTNLFSYYGDVRTVQGRLPNLVDYSVAVHSQILGRTFRAVVGATEPGTYVLTVVDFEGNNAAVAGDQIALVLQSSFGDTIGTPRVFTLSSAQIDSAGVRTDLATVAPGVHIITPRSQVLDPGETGTLEFLIENTGNLRDHFDLSAWSTHTEWIADPGVPTTIGPLLPGETGSVIVTIVVPDSYPTSSMETVVLQACSQIDDLTCDTDSSMSTVPITVDAGSIQYVRAEQAGQNDYVEIRWRSSGEELAIAFRLLRTQENSSSYREIGRGQMLGEGVENIVLDEQVERGMHYDYVLMLEGEPASYHALGGITIPRSSFVLHQNTPNPFNPSTHIRFDLPEAALVTLEIFDVSGALLRTLIDARPMRAALHDCEWDGRDGAGNALGSGVYVYRVIADSQSQSRRMVLIK